MGERERGKRKRYKRRRVGEKERGRNLVRERDSVSSMGQF